MSGRNITSHDPGHEARLVVQVKIDERFVTLLSFDLWRNYYIKNAVLFEENSILPLPECLESSGR